MLTGGTNPQGHDLIKRFYCGHDGKAGAYVPVDPVPLSHHDTADTITAGKKTNAEVDANNAVYKATC